MVKGAGGGVNGGKMEAGQAKKEAELSKKISVKMGPWDVCRKVFNKEEHKAMSSMTSLICISMITTLLGW